MSDYAKQWRELGRLRRNVTIANWIGLLAGIAALIIVEALTHHYFYEDEEMKLAVPIMIWLIPSAIYTKRLKAWPCPRCGESFVGRPSFRDSWRRRPFPPDQCSSCGLPEWAEHFVPAIPVHTT